MPRRFTARHPGATCQVLLHKLAALPTEGCASNARQELRWLCEHAQGMFPVRPSPTPLNITGPRSPQSLSRAEMIDAEYLPRTASHRPPLPRAAIPNPTQRAQHRQDRWLRRAVFDRTWHRKPLQYILGSQPFGDLDVLTRPPTLIPRWETEEWVLQLTRWLAPFLAPRDGSISRDIPSLRIADLCTGSGCIALLLASTLPTGSAKLVGVDRSLAAYTLASDNHTYNRSKLRNPLAFIQADVLAKELPDRLAESFARLKPSGMDPSGGTETQPGVVDLVVANPPYVAGREFVTLEPEVRVWEDRDALVPRMPTAEVDAHILDLGVEFYMRLIPTLVERGLLVTPDSTPLTSSDKQGQDRPLQQLGAESAPPARPKVVLEIGGRHQTRPVAQCLLDQGFDGVGIWSDLAGVERALVAW